LLAHRKLRVLCDREALSTFTLTFGDFVGMELDEGPLAEEVARAVASRRDACQQLEHLHC
jgi:peroxiredoxin